jgi:hypothetical protein
MPYRSKRKKISPSLSGWGSGARLTYIKKSNDGYQIREEWASVIKEAKVLMFLTFYLYPKLEHNSGI